MGSKHWRLQSREDFEELLRAILAPLIPHYSQGGARLKLGATAAVYDQGAVWAEAFLRPPVGPGAHFGPGAEAGLLWKKYTEKALLPVQIPWGRNTGEASPTGTSGLWRWRPWPGPW